MAQKIRIIGVPMDLGASRRGVDMGPSALRVAGLQARIKQLGHQVEDIGNISVKQPEEMSYGEKRAKYLAEIPDPCKDLAGVVENLLDEKMRPGPFKKKEKKIGVIWLDAHGDINTPESSPSGNVHGMPLAAAMGYGATELVELQGFKRKGEPQNFCLVGFGDLVS